MTDSRLTVVCQRSSLACFMAVDDASHCKRKQRFAFLAHDVLMKARCNGYALLKPVAY